MEVDEMRKIVMASLRANFDRPDLLPLDTEDVLDAYVAGVERSARLVAAHLGYDISDLLRP